MDGDRDKVPHQSNGLSPQGPVEGQKEGEDEQWLVNIFWFFREAFLAPTYTEQSQIKGYVWRSAVGFLFWVIVLTTWITVFQIYRPRRGALGDYLSFTIPLGTP
ncbi:Gamma-secretase subunit PEN-2 [Microtus ochrogaster]|uniref:Gamma-secretase subunit PEN-2 n=1 Tax=Microtus ochrogaster TaxID=79684 RepID=A0A8J6FYX4_MICOH|nr:Gamma-secretase subunit PEN-2 [Microtus ochrogaster]